MHSRVARSNVALLQILGASVRLVGPPTLMPAQAERWGLLNECVPGDQLDARIAQIAEGLGGIGIEALRQQKRLLRRWEGMGVDSAITVSVAEFGAAFNTGEPQNHMNAFLERKQAKAQAQPQP